MPEISVQRLDWGQWSYLAPTWERVHNVSLDASFFLSREWVDCWLATFGRALGPDLLTFAKDGEVVGCCLLVWRTQLVRGIPLRRVYLNCSGENEADSTCIEYNGMLAEPEHAEKVAAALGGYLRGRYWDELILQGVVEHSPVQAMARSLGKNEIIQRPSHFVDLTSIRGQGVEYINVLSPKIRKNIRRSLRTFEQMRGHCVLEIARTPEEGVAMLRQLAELHQTHWVNRGQAGVFSSPAFLRFHDRLIRREFGRGTTLLWRLQAGQETVGALYAFAYRGCVYFYQSGFSYTIDSRTSPGLATLFLAISDCLTHQDLHTFDFMAGDSQYKRSLSTASRSLEWIVVRRSTVPSLLFQFLRLAKRACVRTGQAGLF